MISRELEVTLNLAVNEARQRGHEFVTLEHILFALMHNSRAERAIRACGGSSDQLKQALLEFFDNTFDPTIRRMDPDDLPRPTVAFQRVLQRAARHVMTSGRELVEAESVLISIFAERDSFALYFLERQGVSRFDLMRWMAHGVPKDGVDLDGLDNFDSFDPDEDLFEDEEEDEGDEDLQDMPGSGESLEPMRKTSSAMSGGPWKKLTRKQREAMRRRAGYDDRDRAEDARENRVREKKVLESFSSLSDKEKRKVIARKKRRDDMLHSHPYAISSHPGDAASSAATRSAEGPRTSTLARFAVNLNAKARQGGVDPLVGRENELTRMIQVLCRRLKNNPLLVGEAGVGKTALAEGLAARIVAGKVPKALQDVEIFALDLGMLVAGSKYRGDFEERLRSLTRELSRTRHYILFIDEIHTLVGAGSASSGALDASNLLKPALGSGMLRCIGSTTFKEYRQYFEADAAMNRRFQKIDVQEPSPEDTLKILEGLKEHYEIYHDIRYSKSCLQAAVDLSNRYMRNRRLPDKAIDVLDEVGASFAVRYPDDDSGRGRLANVVDVKRVVAQLAHMPLTHLKVSDCEALQNLSSQLKSHIFGQDHAVEAVETHVKLAKSGLNDDHRPQGVFLFAGPTGVGKTELSLQLARVLDIPVLRFDMSEYMERHAVSRLVGAPPGYVGHDRGGLLTDGVIQKPHSVILLDEIEKAHPDVHNILLQVMDRGTLTDSLGREADFRNATVIMTSNVGASEMSQTPIGFDRDISQENSQVQVALKKVFSPEFLNRIDGIVTFRRLSTETAHKIVEYALAEVASKLKRQGLQFSYTTEVREYLTRKGFDPVYGARNLRRIVQEEVRKPLSDLVIFSAMSKGSRIHALYDTVAAGEEMQRRGQRIVKGKDKTKQNPSKKRIQLKIIPPVSSSEAKAKSKDGAGDIVKDVVREKNKGTRAVKTAKTATAGGRRRSGKASLGKTQPQRTPRKKSPRQKKSLSSKPSSPI